MTLPPFAQFWQANELIEMPESEQNAAFVRFGAFRADPQANPLKTPSGKIEIYSERIASFQYPDCPPHPMWLEPDEWHGNAQPGQLQLLSAHPAHRLHSQLNHTTLREQYAVAGREPLTLHPQDAQARQISDGDVVRLWNHRGQVLAGAVRDELAPVDPAGDVPLFVFANEPLSSMIVAHGLPGTVGVADMHGQLHHAVRGQYPRTVAFGTLHEVLAEVHDAAAAQEVREILHRRKVCKRQYSRHK